MKVYHCDACADSYEPEDITPIVTVKSTDCAEKHFCSRDCFTKYYADHEVIFKRYKNALLWAVQITSLFVERIFYVITPDDPGWRTDLAPIQVIDHNIPNGTPRKVVLLGVIVVKADEVLPRVIDESRWIHVPFPQG